MHGCPPPQHAINEHPSIIQSEMHALGAFYGINGQRIGHGCVRMEDVMLIYVDDGVVGGVVGAVLWGGILANT